MKKDTETTMFHRILGDVAVSLGITAITNLAQTINSTVSSVINVYEWDDAYNSINKMVYKLSPAQYKRHRAPTNNKNAYELTTGVRYMIKLGGNNFAIVETSKEDGRKIFFEKSLHIRFIGKDKYIYRNKFLENALKLTDKKKIPVKYLNEYGIQCDITPHSFDNIVLDDNVRSRIILGLKNWRNSKDWYAEHQLVYKIGVLLYGEPGTGKSTVARAISEMFGMAPILVMDINNIMQSIQSIIRMRNRCKGTLVVLIEDIDMYFPKKDDDVNPNPETPNDANAERMNKLNQNAMFQLLDGVYSTDDTIYIATTNYKDKLDNALVRYGRFDIQENLTYMSREAAIKKVELLGYTEEILDKLDITYPVQPVFLQSKIMEYRALREEEST